MTDFKDKTVLITGASRGIGEATARFFAEQGANLILFARNAEALEAIAKDIGNSGGSAISVPGNVASYSDVQNAVQSAIKEYGRLDILVNNAGLIDPVACLAESDPEVWGQIVDVNYKGVYYGIRSAVPEMLKAGGGIIINISSGAATGALEGWSHYCSTKAAVLSLTRCTDKEYGDKGIRVVGLSPGTVATEMQVVIRESGINPVSQLDPSAHIPAEWVAKAIGFLCGEGGAEFAGTDFSIKNNEGRERVGLPAID
ncbi:MAG: SDR family oxidoreductase [Methyloligellaceae bacterium]